MSGFNSLIALDKRPGLMPFLAAGWDAGKQAGTSCSSTDPLLSMIWTCPRARPPPSLSSSDLCSPFSSAPGCTQSHIQIARVWLSAAFWRQMSSKMSETWSPNCTAHLPFARLVLCYPHSYSDTPGESLLYGCCPSLHVLLERGGSGWGAGGQDSPGGGGQLRQDPPNAARW